MLRSETPSRARAAEGVPAGPYDSLPMQLGLALPHYDFSIPVESPLRFETIAATARAAEDRGFDSLRVSDHGSLSIERCGGPPGEQFAYEPLTTLAALAGVVARPR